MLSRIPRLIHINHVLAKHGLDEIILATHLFRPLRFLIYLSPWRWLARQDPNRGVRIRRTLEDLGPIFVKFGQILSTRIDLLPDDIALELVKLQDQVPGFSSAQAVAIIEKAFAKPLSDVFQRFDQQPLASASIAQVHSAQLHDGREVVVKVVRPGIEKIIRRDVDLLYTIAELAARYWSDGKRLRPSEVVREFEKTLFDELDMMREAASASQLKRNFRNQSLLYVPEVYWDYTRVNVMVMERISGTPVSDIAALREQGIELKRLAENGVKIFFSQVFRDSFFHADMHPGNIFVSPQGQYIAVDFGIMGSLDKRDQRYLAENFLAFFRRDYHQVALLHVESGWVPADTRVEEFEAAIRTVCEPMFEKPLAEISFGQVLLRLFQTARRFNMQVQPQLVLLQKTLLNIEGLGRQLYPQLDLWQTAYPFLEKWMQQQIGIPALFKNLQRQAPRWAEILPQLPSLIHDKLGAVDSEREQQAQLKKEIHALRRSMMFANRRLYRAIMGASLIFSALLLYVSTESYNPPMIGEAPLLTWMLGGLGMIVVIFSWPEK